MPLPAADYTALSPAGFENIRTAYNGLNQFIAATNTLKGNTVVISAANGASDPTQTPVALLNQAYGSVGNLAALPVANLRSVVAYANLLSMLLPLSSDVNQLVETLQTSYNAWSALDLSQVTTLAEAATNSTSSASRPIATASSSADVINMLLPISPRPGRPNQLDTNSLFSIFSSCVQPITGNLNQQSSSDQQKLCSIIGFTVSSEDFSKTYVDIKKADASKARSIQTNWATFTGQLSALKQDFNQAVFAIQMAVRGLNGISTAIQNVPLGVNRFKASAQNPPANYEQGATDVVSLWKLVGGYASTYISFVVGGMVVAPTGPTANSSPFVSFSAVPEAIPASVEKISTKRIDSFNVFAAAAPPSSAPTDSTPTPQQVRDTFGPPTYAETALAGLGPDTGKINEKLNNFLQLPYVSGIKVNNAQGVSISLREQVIELQSKYQNLQQQSLPVIRDISAYGSYSKIVLPMIGKPQGLTLSEFLQTNLAVVAKYGKRAKVIATETNQLKSEFQAVLTALNASLSQVESQIKELEASLEQAESEYQKAKVSAILDGIISLAFYVGAVAVLFTSLGTAAEISIGLAVSGTTSLFAMIKSAVEAGRLAEVIDNIKNALNAARQTESQLQTVIPMFGDIVGMMQKIGFAWDAISDNLADVNDDYTAWNNPKLFTPQYLDLTLQSWSAIEQAINLYVDVITGNSIPAPQAAPISLMSLPMAKSFSTAQFSPISEVKVQPVEAKAAINLIQQNSASEEVTRFFSAPKLRGTPIKPEDLSRLQADWSRTADIFNSVDASDLANNCSAIVSTVKNQVAPQMTDAVKTLLDFALKQPQVPKLPVSEQVWTDFYNSRVAVVADGRNKAVSCDTSLRGVMYAAQNVQNFTIAKIGELENQAQSLQKEGAQVQFKLDQLRAIIFLTGPIGALIAQLTGVLRQINDSLRNIGSRLDNLHRALDTVNGCLDNVKGFFTTTANMSLFWSDLTTQTTLAADLWGPMQHMKEFEVDLYKATWITVINAFQGW